MKGDIMENKESPIIECVTVSSFSMGCFTDCGPMDSCNPDDECSPDDK